MQEEPGMVETAPEIPIGEPIVPPPTTGTFLPEAHPVLAGEVAGTPHQQPIFEDYGVAGTSERIVLVLPPKYQYTVPTELIDDPMLALSMPYAQSRGLGSNMPYAHPLF
jgi:hypothetical protein